MDLGSCEGKMIDAIGVSFPLTELDCGEYAKQKATAPAIGRGGNSFILLFGLRKNTETAPSEVRHTY